MTEYQLVNITVLEDWNKCFTIYPVTRISGKRIHCSRCFKRVVQREYLFYQESNPSFHTYTEYAENLFEILKS